MKFLSLPLLAAALATSSAFAAETPTATQEDLLAQARPTIEAANSDWVPAMKRKDAKAIASFYADDGVFIGPNGKAMQGRDAIEKLYALGMGSNMRFVRGSIAQDGVVLVAGPMIYEWGHAEFDVERDGKLVHGGGNYLTVWKRNASGTWQISRNVAM
jgi:uncharacterized protein (TIGR02246 family)